MGIEAGSGSSGSAAHIRIDSGQSAVSSGGFTNIASGEGSSVSSGAVTVKGCNSGVQGSSGRLTFSSGSSQSGNIGAVLILSLIHI